MSDNDTGSLPSSNGDRDELTRFIRDVEAFEIDPGDKALRFVDRLARENAWTTIYAERVIVEYKRFAILAMRCGHPVTPSEQVDQVWHLHLTYTRSYWGRFREVLGGPLHHGPTEGGASEHEKYLDWYTRTLASYRVVFGAEPPPDIWPSPTERFAHAGQWRWINTAHCWTLPKRQVRIASGLGLVGAASLAWQLTGRARPSQPVHAASLDPTLAVVFPFTLDGSAFL